jgi:flagellar biosynthesis protein FlhB
MSGESEDDSSKTEEPSHKKLEEARKKGQIPATRELNHFFMMLALTFFVFTLGSSVGNQTLHLLSPFITKPDMFDMSAGGVNTMLSDVVFGFMGVMGLTFLLTFAAAIAPAILQRKWVISGQQVQPKLSKISPMAGFGRIFGMKALVEFIKNFIKISVVCIICTVVVLPYRHELPHLLNTPDKNLMVYYSARIAGKILIAVCIFLFLLSIIDYLYQRFIIMKSLRMSKQELKDEYKQQEGDPHIKGKLRQIRRERAKKRMMANVPKADVIITNPTHFAVALKYDAATMPAPIVLAKGADAVAARIRELATDNKIPIVRNPPLARILYDTTEIDDEIPIEHYQAVAKIIGYVYRLKGKLPPEKANSTATKKSKLPTLNMKK